MIFIKSSQIKKEVCYIANFQYLELEEKLVNGSKKILYSVQNNKNKLNIVPT